MLRPTGQEAGSQQVIRKQSRGAVSRDPEDVLQALLVLEQHQGQGGLGGGRILGLASILGGCRV